MQKEQWLALIYGWVVILTILIISSMIIAVILKFTSFNEPLLSWITLAVGILALFIGGLVAGLKGQMRGWIIGLSVGVGFTFFTLLIQYTSYAQMFSLEQILYHLLFIFAAMIGGIVGVNRITT